METNNKLREALTKILNLTNSLDEDCAVDPVEIRDIAKAALAEPVRNYEVGTAEEQYKRFMDECMAKDVRQCANCKLRTSESCGRDRCFAQWSQMPYEEGGAK